MSEAATAPAPQPQPSSQSSNRRNAERGRSGRGRSGRGGALAFRPTQVPPASSTTTEVPREVQPSRPAANSDRPRRSRRGGNQPARGRNERLTEQRQFGGSLTHGALEAASNESAPARNLLEHDQTSTISHSTKSQRQRPARRRLSRSTAPDIATRVHEDIDNRNYECPICTSEVLRNSKVWSCHTCWTVFHLGCIKQWAANSEATAREQAERNGAAVVSHPWRCPGCNLPQEKQHLAYSCWCGKDDDPRSITGLPPHSCGQTCGKERIVPKKCPHPCELLCHAGPCPPCSQMGPRRACFCGKEDSVKKCIDTLYDAAWSCGQKCGESMPCGEHECERECHGGLCGACEVRIEARCYCGKEERSIMCCDKDDDTPATRKHKSDGEQDVTESWTGLFTCSNICQRPFDCGQHFCQKSCHATTDPQPHCPRSPDIVKCCPCGKTALSELMDQPRQSCTDPVPNCGKLCLKALSCGHPCQQPCHTGDCMPCLMTTTISCRCTKTESATICHQGSEERPQCMRVCHTTLNCGRHECGERCCTGERRAIERLASRKKGRPIGSARPAVEDFEAEHICTRLCGRTLKCGNHTCQELCHKGPCGSCREAIFDEISCNCGRTVLQPPLPCGTSPPPCRWPCERPKTCGHAQVQHNCHTDDESCPKCPFLTSKQCLCGKSTMKNQPCWLVDVRCGQVCGAKLGCGIHFCRKTCHRSGECEDATSKCTQPCGRPKKLCGHPCEDPCHAPYPCKQDKPCAQKKLITCACQTRKAEVRCGATAANADAPPPEKTLKCDDECARLERNRQLASALDIDPETHTNDHVPYSAETLALFGSLPARFTADQERELRLFAVNDAQKRLRFKPMKAPERAFLHALAEDYGIDSESMDPEPHRHVALFKTPRFGGAPAKTLRDALRARHNAQQQAQGAAATKPAPATKPEAQAPFNALLLTAPRFALTEPELRAECAAALPDVPLDPLFLRTGDVALLGAPGTSETALRAAHITLQRAFARAGTGALELARLAPDGSGRVLRRDTDPVAGTGWSQVAAKSAAPRAAPGVQGVGVRSSFTVLGSAGGAAGAAAAAAAAAAPGLGRKKEKRLRRERERAEASVVEDWEAEMDREEEGAGAATPAAAPAGESLGEAGAAVVTTEETEPKTGTDAA